LEELGFEWDSLGAAWEGRLSRLTDYHLNPQAQQRSLQTIARTSSWVMGLLKGTITGYT
jgi:hypothetical protein